MGHLTRFFRRLLNVIRSGRDEASTGIADLRLTKLVAPPGWLLAASSRRRSFIVTPGRSCGSTT